tara:strand:+ start:195 stop:380 length:186 start_codon:yes stop_codon:yes gene_type:complete
MPGWFDKIFIFSPLSSAKQGSFQLETLPAYCAFIIAFSSKLFPVSLGEFLVNSDKGMKVIL